MGNEISSKKVGVEDEMVEVTRYTSSMTIRYQGTYKVYVYISRQYNLEIHPGDGAHTIRQLDESHWRDVSNERVTVKVKKVLLEACKEFLKAQDTLLNEIQKEFDVS